MTYRIVRSQRAWWPVEFPGVTEDGEIVGNKIEMRFHQMKVDTGASFLREVLAAEQREMVEGVDAVGIYSGLVARMADDWRGLEAENGEPMKFDGAAWLAALADRQARLDKALAFAAEADEEAKPAATAIAAAIAAEIPSPKEGGENLRLLMNEPGMFGYVFAAWRDCQAKKAKVREGN